MSIIASCPSCGKKLKVPDEARGKKLLCPHCKNAFQLPLEVESVPVAPVEPSPRQSPKPTPSANARDFAAAADINLNEVHRESVPDSAYAERMLSDWKSHLPEVKSAYQPSGALPAAAIVWLGLGSGVGALAGVLTVALMGTITLVVVGLIVGLIALVDAFCGVVFCLSIVLVALLGLAGYILTFVAQGYACGLCAAGMGRLGKNRNATAAALFSMASVVMGIVLIAVAMSLIDTDALADWIGKRTGLIEDAGPEVAEVAAPKDENNSSLDFWVGWGGLILGGLIATVLAGLCGAGMVLESKFCEECEQFMVENEVREFALGGVKTMALALDQRNLDVVEDVLQSRAGTSGKAMLFHCADCGKGYFELTAQFKANWPHKDETKTKAENWLAASIDLTNEEVNRFLPHIQKS